MKVERITTYERFVDIKMDWNTLLFCSGQNCPFLTHQWFDAWWKCFGQDGELEILFFWDDSGSLGGIAPMMVSDAALRFMASHEVTDYCDFISCVDNRDEFYANLLDYFQTNISKYSHVEFINIPDSSPTLSSIRGLSARHEWEYKAHESEIVPILVLPGSYDEFLQNLSRKNRHELRRKTRKLESLGKICIERITELEVKFCHQEVCSPAQSEQSFQARILAKTRDDRVFLRFGPSICSRELGGTPYALCRKQIDRGPFEFSL